MTTRGKVHQFYQSVIEEVVSNVREAFLDEGMDDQLLYDFKNLWESKLSQSKAIQEEPEMGLFAKQQISHKSTPKPVQTSIAPPQPKAAPAPAPAPTSYPSMVMPQQGQQPPIIFNPMTGQVEMSAAATSGQMAALRGFLPPGMNVGSQQMQILLPSGMVPQAFVPRASQPGNPSRGQVDGPNDGSSSDDDDDDDDHDKDDDEDQNDEENDEGKEEGDPLNSDDDTSEADPQELFETENVVVCQFEKINRTRNRWRFVLKDGIMTLKGKDFVFQKASGDADW